MYPTVARIKDKEYELNTSFKTGLKCFDVIDDPDITDQERSLAIIYLLFGFIPNEDIDLFLDRAKKFLQCGETTEEQIEKEKDMDFIQDEKYIVASFMSDYKIDLSKEELHWWQFINLIQGLTKDSVLSNVREIRNYDLSEINDPKDKQKVIKAKEQVALKKRKSQKEAQDDLLFENLIKGKEE